MLDRVHQFIRIDGFLGIEIVELDEFRAVDGQFEIENSVAGGKEGDAALLGLVEVGIDAEHHLLVECQHLRLVLRDVGLQLTGDLAGEVADHMVHPLAHDIAGVGGGLAGGEV